MKYIGLAVLCIAVMIGGCGEFPVHQLIGDEVPDESSTDERTLTVKWQEPDEYPEPRFPVQDPETLEDLTNTSFDNRIILGLDDDFTFSISTVWGIAVKTRIFVSKTPLTAEMYGKQIPRGIALDDWVQSQAAQCYVGLSEEESVRVRTWNFYNSTQDLYFDGDDISRPYKVEGFISDNHIRVEEQIDDILITLPFSEDYEGIADRWQYIYIVSSIIPAETIQIGVFATYAGQTKGDVTRRPHFLKEATLFFEVVNTEWTDN